jgi:hypothetical protein
MSYRIEIVCEREGVYAIHRINDNEDDYVILIGDGNFMQKLSSALKGWGF